MAIDTKASRAKRSRSRSVESGLEVKKRTPLEQAIAVKTNRNARYEARMRQEGFKKTTIWSLEEYLADVLAVNRLICGEKGEEFALRLRELVSQMEPKP